MDHYGFVKKDSKITGSKGKYYKKKKKSNKQFTGPRPIDH